MMHAQKASESMYVHQHSSIHADNVHVRELGPMQQILSRVQIMIVLGITFTALTAPD